MNKEKRKCISCNDSTLVPCCYITALLQSQIFRHHNLTEKCVDAKKLNRKKESYLINIYRTAEA